MGDPMFDLAGLIHWFVLDTRQETRLLKSYFQRDPTEHERAKLTLMKQVSWCFYAVVFLLISIQGGGPRAMETIECEQLPSFAEAIQAITRGEIRLENAGTRRWMSLVIAKQSLDEMMRPEFSRALTCLDAVSTYRSG
jgi:hypothetical protein